MKSENDLSVLFTFLSVKLYKLFLTCGDFRIHENGVHRAHRCACTTLDALIGVNVQLRFAIKLVNTIYRAYTHAGFIFNVYAGFTDYKRHMVFSVQTDN
jgi:hypothetical protein